MRTPAAAVPAPVAQAESHPFFDGSAEAMRGVDKDKGRLLETDTAYPGLAEGTAVRVLVSQPMWASSWSEPRAACAGPIAEVTSDPPPRRGATP